MNEIELQLTRDARSALDAACVAFAAATTDDDRERAAVIAARAHVAGEEWGDAVTWSERAIAIRATPIARALRGWALFRTGHHERGLAELDAVAVAEPTLVEAHLWRGQALADLDRHADAIAALSPAASASAEARRRRGLACLALDARTDAIADLVAAARDGDAIAVETLRDRKHKPRDLAHRIADATHGRSLADGDKLCAKLLDRNELTAAQRATMLCVRANAANNEGEWDAAVALREAAVAAQPDDALLLADLAHELWNAGRFDDAIVAAERAIAVGPTGGQAEQTIAMSHHVAKRLDDAERWYLRALARRPRAPDALFQLGRVLVALGRDADGVARIVEAAAYGSEAASAHLVNIDEPEPVDFQRAAVGSMESGDHAAAADHFEREAALWSTLSRAPGDSAACAAAVALANASCAHRLAGDPRAAEALARRATATRPGSHDAWAHLGDHLYTLGRFDDAVAAYARASEIDPRHAWPHYGASGARRASGDAAGALAAIDRAIAIGYSDDGKTRDLYLRRAHICQATGDWDGAEAAYRRRAELAAGHPAYALPALNVTVAREIAKRGPNTHAPHGYRRYGLALDMWVHSEFPMAFRVQLAAVPRLADRIAIARIVRRALSIDHFALDEPWSWSDRFVVIRLCPSEAARPHPRSTFAAIAKAFDAIHAAHPIVEVVALGARSIDRDDRAERWSIASQPVPDPGPFFDEPVALWPEAIADVRRFPSPVVDPAVEEARSDRYCSETSGTELGIDRRSVTGSPDVM